VLSLLAGAAAPQNLEAREKALAAKLVAACCWSEPISVHRSDTAAEMRAELHQLLVAGRSDREILDWFQNKYGKRVLIEPEGGASVLIYGLPAAVGLLGLAGVVWLVRRWAARARAAEN
jgi:cytochrome c-type biogenesis protein CcmH